MTREEIDSFIDELGVDNDIMVPANLDEGFVGVCMEADDDGARAVYSIEKCIKKLSEDMTHEEATEYFWFNVAGTHGIGYPMWISTPEDSGGSPYK